MPDRAERHQHHRKHRSRSSHDLGYDREPDFDRYERRRDDFDDDDMHASERRSHTHKSRSRERRKHGSSREGRGSSRADKYEVQPPDSSIVLEGYREDILNGFEEPQARYNPVSYTIHTLSQKGTKID